jgi:predicted nucleic acid-binding protein
MNLYVETNFVLELALQQEQHEACEGIIRLCEARSATLVLPAFCIAESYETLIRRANRRTQIANDLAGELRQLSRSKPYKEEIDTFRSVTGLLARSSQEEDARLIAVLERILRVVEIIPLEAGIVLNAVQYRVTYKLEPQDSIVYASVIQHLATTSQHESCFLNRNNRDFDDPDIEESLARHNCKMLFSFINGYNYIRHKVDSAPKEQ